MEEENEAGMKQNQDQTIEREVEEEEARRKQNQDVAVEEEQVAEGEEAFEAEEEEDEEEEHSKIPSFGDGTIIRNDWTKEGLIDDPIAQRRGTGTTQRKEEEDGISIGGKPKTIKGPNPINVQLKAEKALKKQQREEAARKIQQDQEAALRREQEEEAQRKLNEDLAIEGEEEAEEEEVEDEAVEEEEVAELDGEELHSKIPSFGDGTVIIKDWTRRGLVDDPILQVGESCGSVVLTRLVQYFYNKDLPVTQHLTLSYKHLALYIQSQTKNSGFSFRNLNIPFKFIEETGIHKEGYTNDRGVKIKGKFKRNLNATKEEVHNVLERTPLGIIIENFPNFYQARMGIYKVPRFPTDETQEHALLVVGRGTANGNDFLVVQNSWGVDFGNNGYCRLSLPDNGTFKIYWPTD